MEDEPIYSYLILAPKARLNYQILPEVVKYYYLLSLDILVWASKVKEEINLYHYLALTKYLNVENSWEEKDQLCYWHLGLLIQDWWNQVRDFQDILCYFLQGEGFWYVSFVILVLRVKEEHCLINFIAAPLGE